MNKIKQINCVNCPKFCQAAGLDKLRQLISASKSQGFEEIRFNCETGQQIIKDLA